jgi:hypothetical protein
LFVIHYKILEYFLFILFNLIILYMTKSRKKRGGNTSKDMPESTCGKGGATCPKINSAGSSLMAITAHGVKKTNAANAHQQAKISALGQGGGSRKRRKKRGGGDVICPQPAAGSGGSISAGASSAGANMCSGTKHTMQQHASSTYDKQAKSLDINPPCDPFSGSCPSSGGGKRKRRRRKRRKTRKKTRRRKRRKTRRRKRKSRRRR